MSTLTAIEIITFEKLFAMSNGYVLDFDNSKFSSFVQNSINLDIYKSPGYSEYCSKANKLRQIWRDESDLSVGRLLSDLIEYFLINKANSCFEVTENEQLLIEKAQTIADRLKEPARAVTLPVAQEETLQELLEDINHSLSEEKPRLVLDRLHTFSSKFIKQICVSNKITITKPDGQDLPLHSLAGMLKKHYEKIAIFQSRFTLLAIQNSISLFEAYNQIRNEASYAHANDLLDIEEATFAIKIMSDFLVFIEKIEKMKPE